MNDIIIGGTEMSQFYVKPVIFGCPVTQRTENAKSASNIFIIDTSGAYSSFIKMMGGTSILISNDSANYINPFEYDLSLLNDEKIDVISDKCQLITALISLNQKLSLSEISFIDHCVRQTYLSSNFYKSHNKSDFPILRNLCDIMESKADYGYVNENSKRTLNTALDVFVNGSLKCFNNRSNITAEKHFISYDIKLSGTEKTQAALLVLERVWNLLSANKEKGEATWIIFLGTYDFFRNEYCSQYIRELYKRVMRYEGIVFRSSDVVSKISNDSKDSFDFDLSLLNDD